MQYKSLAAKKNHRAMLKREQKSNQKMSDDKRMRAGHAFAMK